MDEHSGLDDAARLDVAGYHPERAGRHRGDARRDPNKSDTSSIRHSVSSRPFHSTTSSSPRIIYHHSHPWLPTLHHPLV